GVLVPENTDPHDKPVYTTNGQLFIGRNYMGVGTNGVAYGQPFKGRFDELRISKTDRGADYVKAAYVMGNDANTVKLDGAPVDILQVLINATPDGGTLTLTEAAYKITKPLYIPEGKDITIVGLSTGTIIEQTGTGRLLTYGMDSEK